jgi:hypothetical protein
MIFGIKSASLFGHFHGQTSRDLIGRETADQSRPDEWLGLWMIVGAWVEALVKGGMLIRYGCS